MYVRVKLLVLTRPEMRTETRGTWKYRFLCERRVALYFSWVMTVCQAEDTTPSRPTLVFLKACQKHITDQAAERNCIVLIMG